MSRTITVYEHQPLRAGDGKTDLRAHELKQLEAFYGSGADFPYYRLIYRGVKFGSYVGVLRVGELTIEILPKADRSGDDNYWRDRLFDMLRVVHDLPLTAPSTAGLRTRPHDVLHLYLRLLLEHAEGLFRRGLHRAYHEERANATALSGRLLFTEHLRRNLVHRERFFVARDRFDFDTPHNRLLGQALRLAARLSDAPALSARFRWLLSGWPELPETPPTAAVFDRLRFPRGTEAYRPALAIARLLLLRHAPVRTGGRDLPALLFNINSLWERFLEISLRRSLPNCRVTGQRSSAYYHLPGRTPSVLQPDISIFRGDELLAILDAKWKLPSHGRPGPGDLQQLYTYAHFHGARRVGLLYPGGGAGTQVQGRFGNSTPVTSDVDCTLFFLPLPRPGDTRSWSGQLGGRVRDWLAGPD